MTTALKDPKPIEAGTLARDIDDLRMKMAETFIREASLTADPVILISMELDVKINEFMKEQHVRLKKAR